jgi:hypothetical protein
MPVDGAKCKMLVEGVLKEAFAAGGEKKAYNKARVAGWSAEVLSGVCDKMSAMEEADFKFIGACPDAGALRLSRERPNSH